MVFDRLAKAGAIVLLFASALLGVAAAGAAPPSNPACAKSSVTSSQMKIVGHLVLVDTWPAGLEIDRRYLARFDDNPDGRLDAGDARFKDSLGFRKQDGGPVLPPRQAGVRRVYLTNRGASLDKSGRRPVRVYARSCLGMANLAPGPAPRP